MTVVNATKVLPAVSCECDSENLTVSVSFADGTKVVVDATRLNDDIRNYAVLHGIKQKLIDAAALPRDTVTGRSATIGDKVSAVREVFERITSVDGTWNKIRASGEGAVQTGGLFVRALMQLGGKTRDEIVAQLETLTKEQRSALRANKRVVDAMSSLRETSADSDELLDSMIG